MTLDDRVSRVQDRLGPGQGALLTEFQHRVFFLRFPSSAGVVFLTANRRFLLVDFRYIEMAQGVRHGFQVILQEDLSAQLMELADQEGIRAVFTDVEALSWDGMENLKTIFPAGVLQEAPGFSQFLRELEKDRVTEEISCAEKAKKISARIERRFARYVRQGASLRELKRKLGEIRGEEGDESRTFAASFSVTDGTSPSVLPGGDVLCVQFDVVVGLVSEKCSMRFPVSGLPPVPVRERMAYLRELFWEEGSAVLLAGRPNLFYYLGKDPGSGTWLFLTEEMTLLLGERDPEIPGVEFLSKEEWDSYMRLVVRKSGIRRIYTEQSVPLKTLDLWRKLPCQVLPSGELEERIYRRRSVKGEEELARLREAQAITDRVFLESLNYLHAGMSDIEIQRIVGILFHDLGSQMDSFNHVSGCGKGTSLPHVKPTGLVAQPGDFIMLDIGAQVEGYGSDMTRMIGVGQMDEEKKAIYSLVLQAQMAGLQAVRSGAVCSEVDRAARQVIEEQGYGQFFLHGLGHPVGCGGREGPRFSRTDDSVLDPGVVMTVEPGVYLPGKFGVRIEDMVYVGKDGVENLTHSPKNLFCVT